MVLSWSVGRDYTLVLGKDNLTRKNSLWKIDHAKRIPQMEDLDPSIPIQDISQVKVTNGVEWIGNWDNSKSYATCNEIPSYLTDIVCSRGHGECISDESCKFVTFFLSV